MNRKSLFRYEACLKYLQQYPLGSLFFLTLTTPNKDSAQSKLKLKMPSLITNLLGRKNILYVKVVEADQRGRVHWHFILVLPWDAGPEIVARHLIETEANQWTIERKHYTGRIRDLSNEYRKSMKKYGVGRFNMTPVINLKKLANYMTKCKYEAPGSLPGNMRRWSCSKQLKVIHGDFAFVSQRARAQRLLTALVAFSKGCLDLDEIRSRYGRSWWYFEIRPETDLILEMIAEKRQMDLIYYLIPGRQANPEGTTNRMIVQLHRRAFKDLLCLLDTDPTAQQRGCVA
ncbi:hypothetical protein SH580_13130 [Coraliomargarita algicola]|uniref:Replication-associated protein ORF2/G2P domain-containing protein n=1 Tax=Coraliomargarita algicola TaxID=3092156 RepID=A0ABZ0RED7_9BACT|nr:hypothetical protein [Coraliomargarita sp. J2-16]WPJ94376.1 hypothetical protein SH580_13130 [Coraliomargarita sp. J2-16]